ncbi:hypothetical protein JXL83_10100 [candidate division WOR-3 bacterium]|nr:hypothetical protein [candidate division WOR-3 bacterium]
MRTVLLVLLITAVLAGGCSEKASSVNTSQDQTVPENNYLSFNLKSAENLKYLKDGDYVLAFSGATVTEGSYSSLSLLFSSAVDSLDSVCFELMLPATDRFSVFVGMCTPEGCVLDLIKPEDKFTVCDSEYVGIMTAFDEPISPAIHLSYIREGKPLETVSFDKFEITFDSFMAEDVLISALSSCIKLSSAQYPELVFQGNFSVSEKEPVQMMVD